jgi:hypothetical protein
MVFEERKKLNSAATRGMWQLKGMRRNTDTGRCPLCLGEEDIIHILLDYLQTRNWRIKLLYDKWLSMNVNLAYRKILRCSNKDQIRNLGRYFDKINYK